MRRSNKHQSNKITFAGLTGGVNVSQTGEQIGDTDMQECENFIYGRNSQKLVGRGGLSAPFYAFEAVVKDLFYDVDTNTVSIFLADKASYSMVVSEAAATLMGYLTGTAIPTCVKFQDKLWIASGGLLQYYDYSGANGIFTVTSSPICNIVLERFARLAVIATGSDRVTYCATGDGVTWTINTNDPSMAQWIDVGYGDSGDIVSVVPLATDLIVLKSNGKIYQFAGDADYTSWVVYNVANNADVKGISCAANIGNGVVFLSNRGLKSLNAVMDYGNIAATDIGDKFNSLITNSMYEPRMFHLRRHSTILIRPTDDWTYFISYNYLLNAATVVKFAIPIASIVETADEIIVASGTQLFKLADDYATDNGAAISYKLKPKDTIGNDQLLLKSIDTKLTADYAGTATVTADNLQITVPTNTRQKTKCNHSTDCVSVEITSNDRFELDHIALEVAQL